MKNVQDRLETIKENEKKSSRRAWHAWNSNQGIRDLDYYKIETIFAGSQGRAPKEIVEPLGSIAGESRFGNFPGLTPNAGSLIQPAAQTSLSRTSYHQFFPGGYANAFAHENRFAEERLKSVEERIKRGKDNNQLHLE